MVVERFHLLEFVSPPFSHLRLSVTPKVSSLHKKQETFTMLSLFLQNMTTTGSYPACFLCHPVTPWEGRRGENFRVGALKTTISFFDWPSNFFWFFLFFLHTCLSEAISSCDHLRCQVKQKEKKGRTEPGGPRIDGNGILICSRPWEGPGFRGFRSPASCSPCRSCRSPAPGAPGGVWYGRFAPSEGKPAPLQSGGNRYPELMYWRRRASYVCD